MSYTDRRKLCFRCKGSGKETSWKGNVLVIKPCPLCNGSGWETKPAASNPYTPAQAHCQPKPRRE